MITCSSARSVTSTGTTAVAPGGTGDPVVIHAAVPRVTSISSRYPAVCLPTISRQGDGSSAITAYPSIVAAGNGGWSSAATTSLASTRHGASRSATSSTGIRGNRSKIFSRASSGWRSLSLALTESTTMVRLIDLALRTSGSIEDDLATYGTHDKRNQHRKHL